MTDPHKALDMRQKKLNILIKTSTNTMDNIEILQHNVAHWKLNRHNFTNVYKEINPDKILINSHGLKELM